MNRRIGFTTTAALLLAAGTARSQPPAPTPAAAPASPAHLETTLHAAQAQLEAARATLSQRQSTETYRSGIRRIDERQYDRAIESFDRVIRDRGARADGALYWKAYSLRRLGRGSEAQAALAELEKTYPASRWKNDAKALEVEIRQMSGEPVSPASNDDEDLKLLALNGLAHTDPDSAIPLIDKMLASPKNPPRLKQRALFVLAQSRNSRAAEILTQYAKGGANPDLQLSAIDYLGATNTAEARQVIGEIYRGSSDQAVKRTALQGLMRARDKAQLFQIAKEEQDLEMKREAIRYLGNAGGLEELRELFAVERDRQTRLTLAETICNHAKVPQLIEMARAEKDAEVKKEIVRRLGESRSKEAQAYLLELLQE